MDRSGEGAAVTRQREDCLKLCEERGWTVERIFIENDTSASARKPRPEYQAMLAGIEAGEADVVVAWHVDRLTRKLTELEDLIELANRTGVRIAAVTGDLDLSTDAGRLVGRILASVARGEVERKGARQRRAQQQAAEQGRPAGGRRAFGYDRTGNTVNEREAAVIRQAYASVLQGESLKSIARAWNEAGFPTTAGGTWRHDNVRGVLQNARYAGLRTYRGEVVGPATWEPLIDRDTYDAVAAILSAPSRRTTTGTARKHLLPGLAYCWKCGSDVATGHTRHGKRVYVCRANKCISRKADPVDALVAGGDLEGVEVRGLVVERLSRPDAADLLRHRDDPDVQGMQQRAEGIRERLDDLATGLEEGILTLGAVRKSSARLRQELDKVEATIAATVKADTLAPLVSADDIDEAWQGYDVHQRRAVIEALMKITLLKPGNGVRAFDPETVRIEWKVMP